MGDKKEYNGWTNYCTWAVHLWITNDQYTYNHYINEAKHIKENPEYFKIGETEYLREPLARLEDLIKHEIVNNNPLDECGQSSSLYMDLLTWGLADVNYREIAKSFLEGL